MLSETVILVDIEGTTTSVSFVKDVLFPYVRENLNKYIESKWEDEEFKKDFEKLKEQAKKDEEDKVDGVVPIAGANTDEEKKSLVKNILWQMDGDRKTGALKQLQGHIWREAYNSGAVKAHVYEDVPKALEAWTNDGKKVYVYSSGSVEAQKLLFGHTAHGDLLKYFSGYFDTEVGGKQESSSYKNILNKIGAEPSSVIFLTDVVKEAAAAKETGLSAMLLEREGNTPLTDEDKVTFTSVKSFLDLTFQASTKRQKLETTETQEAVTAKEVTAKKDTSEPMDTSEDVEMSDVSEKKDEKVEAKKAEPVPAETKESAKETPSTEMKVDEPMITDAKEAPVTESVAEPAVTEKIEAQPSEVSTKPEVSESVPVVSNTTESTTPSKTDADKATPTENACKPMDTEKVPEPAPVTATPTASEPLDVATSEPKSKSEEVPATEKKTEETTNVAKETKSEESTVPDVKTNENASQEKSSSNNVEEKAEECPKPKSEKEASEEPAEKVVAKPSTVVEPKKSESEETTVKPKQETAKADEKPVENGDVPLTNVEKVTAPTITESEATSSKADADAEAKKSTETETKQEMETEPVNDKVANTKEPEEAPAAVPAKETEEKEASADAAKQETKEKPVKEDVVVDEVKDTNTVDSEKKKLNGTTQNGDTDVPVSDDKLHRNGLNEGSSSETVKSSAASESTTSAQNGEPESSSEANAESIKVKKVVDSTVADGAGEPDVVPPVVVAATS